MNLKDFSIDFAENVLISTEIEGSNQEDEITRDIIEYIKDTGDVVEPEICHFRQKGIKVNAYDYDPESNTLDLFVTVVKPGNGLQNVSDADITNAYERLGKFYKEAASGKLIEKVDESSESAYELVQIIQDAKDSLEHVRFFVLTNGLASPDIVPENIVENIICFDYYLWDIGRVFQQYSIKAGKQKIEIDFLTDYNHRLKCLRVEDVSEKVDAYLAIIPGEILADIYGKYQQGLLEKNVRTFLQFKAKVNRGIRKSILEEPDMFFAYNNGISTTAESVEIEYEDNTVYITRINNWQIVNGGQTTASLYSTSLDKNTDLSKVFIQMKLSVIRKDVPIDLIVPYISKYANSQTAIKDSDFSSNDPYHVLMETYSRQEWIPSKTGGKATSKWFYERTRGQYLDEQSQKKSATDLKRFKIEYPKQKKFTKTDLAKYEMSWLQRPYDVSKGAENNYRLFESELKKNPVEVTKTYYQRMIAKTILFKEIDKIVLKKQLGGYKANMVSYLIALLSYKTNQKLDLDYIWENQTLSENLFQIIDTLIPTIWDHINSPLKSGMNIGEWCKKVECWNSLTDKYFNIERLKEEIKSEADDSSDSVPEYTPAEIKLIEDTSDVSPVTWFSLSKWAKEHSYMSPLERKAAYNFGSVVNRNQKLTLKQAKLGAKILKQAKELGFKE
ncbi:MAG: AIPR family protein [Bacteroides thetaiotaomicron]|nr:AIPR family protein [Bacteroides thetaiotaomicron]